MLKRLNTFVAAAGPLGFLLMVFLLGFVWLSGWRLIHFGLHAERLGAVEDVWRMFPIGLRMDSITLSVLLLLPTLILFGLPGRRFRGLLLTGLLTVIAAVLIYMEFATPPFIEEYDTRPNRVFFEYLLYPKEVFSTLFKDYLLILTVGSTLVVLITYGFWRFVRFAYARADDWAWWKRVLLLPLLVLLLALGARSTLGHRAVNISRASFSGDHLANELALNSTYSLLYAIYNLKHEEDASKIYGDGDMEMEEAIRRVRHYTGLPASVFRHAEIPTLRRQSPPRRDSTPPNLVIFAQESLGARYVGSLGGLPLTPNIDRLSEQGLYLTRLYATGTRTVRGLEALATGFPPTPAPSVLKLSLAQKNFFTLAELLRRQGYTTEFIYGGVSNFDNMGGFFLRNGFDRVIDQDEFTQPVFLGTWGVSDEDLVAKANETFKAHGDQPFFALMLSTTNHTPFEFPPGRIELHEQPANTRHNAMKYADFAIGRLFELAQKEDYFRNTIFVVVSDHDTRVRGAHLVPIDRFHVPALIIGPGVPKQRLDLLASQIDLAPTLLGLMGIDAEHPMIGSDLLAAGPGDKGRAMMQYGMTNAFRVGDDVIIHEPGGKVGSYVWREGKLIKVPGNLELERDALAHLLWASWAYNERTYRLPQGGAMRGVSLRAAPAARAPPRQAIAAP